MPTEYGPVSLRFQLKSDGEILDVSFESEYHHPPQEVVLHVPPIKELVKVIINGEAKQARSGDILRVK